MGNNKNQKDKIRSVLFAIQAANVPIKMRHLRIGYNLEQAIRNSGVVIKAGNGVIWNKGKFFTESLVDQIFEDSYNLGVHYREQAKKIEEDLKTAHNMNEYDVKRLALVLALQAEIEGMKAENTQREFWSHDITYEEGDFQKMAEKLRNLANLHNDQL